MTLRLLEQDFTVKGTRQKTQKGISNRIQRNVRLPFPGLQSDEINLEFKTVNRTRLTSRRDTESKE